MEIKKGDRVEYTTIGQGGATTFVGIVVGKSKIEAIVKRFLDDRAAVIPLTSLKLIPFDDKIRIGDIVKLESGELYSVYWRNEQHAIITGGHSFDIVAIEELIKVETNV